MCLYCCRFPFLSSCPWLGYAAGVFENSKYLIIYNPRTPKRTIRNPHVEDRKQLSWENLLRFSVRPLGTERCDEGTTLILNVVKGSLLCKSCNMTHFHTLLPIFLPPRLQSASIHPVPGGSETHSSGFYWAWLYLRLHGDFLSYRPLLFKHPLCDFIHLLNHRSAGT